MSKNIDFAGVAWGSIDIVLIGSLDRNKGKTQRPTGFVLVCFVDLVSLLGCAWSIRDPSEDDTVR